MKKLRILLDESPYNPREDDNLSIIAYKHSRYTLGDEAISDPIDWLAQMTDQDVKEYSDNELERLEDIFFTEYIALPVYLYDHSGLTLRTTCFSNPWDSGKVGYIYTTKERVIEEYGSDYDQEKILGYLRNELELMNCYINGDVYGFVLEEDGEEIDSCWGLYGTDFENNGIKDYLPEEVWDQLEDPEIEY